MRQNISELNHEDLIACHERARQRYQAFQGRDLKLNMARGKPSPEQLDLVADLLALPVNKDYLAADGTDCRNYAPVEGLQGLPEARALFSQMLGVKPDRVVIAGNSSLALMHDIIVYSLLKGTCDGSRPWLKEQSIKFICPVPGYDRHFFICQEFDIEMISVPLGAAGPDMDQVEKLVAKDPGIKGMWCVPKYSNPTGTIYSDEVIGRLAAMNTAAPDFRLFWDNAYAMHHLTSERTEIANIVEACARHGHINRPFVFSSTSKITLAGAGLAMFASSPDNIKWLLARMDKRTIGPDKINQLRHVRFLRDEAGIVALMDRHRQIVAPKFAKVIEVFKEALDGYGAATWQQPKGGYFISLDVLPGCARRVVDLAKKAGIVLTPAGATYPYGRDPQDCNIRIAPTYPSLSEINQAAEGVALCILLATTEALLAHMGKPSSLNQETA
jgi:DNA-binding transcriptional MocR family regulator